MTKAPEPGSYAEAVQAAQDALRLGRLNDPGEHFPYKHDVVTALVAENPPAGPEGPDDDRLRVEDYMSQGVADASRAYIDAQAAYLTDPGDGTRAEYDQCRSALVAARQEHRANRRSAHVGGVQRAPRAGE